MGWPYLRTGGGNLGGPLVARVNLRERTLDAIGGLPHQPSGEVLDFEPRSNGNHRLARPFEFPFTDLPAGEKEEQRQTKMGDGPERSFLLFPFSCVPASANLLVSAKW